MPERKQSPSDAEPKWCTHCAEKKPLEDFHLDMTAPDGHKSVCKLCRAMLDAESRDNALDPRIEAVEEDLANAVATMPAGGTCSPHHAEIGESIMRRCGGVEGYARLYMAHIYCTKPGSAERGKSLRDIMQLHIKLADSNNERLETMTEADLQRIMTSAIRDYQQKLDLPDSAIPTLNAPSKRTAKDVAP